MAADEEVLLVSEHVRYKKNKGKLKLLSDKIVWTADGAHKPRLSYAYSDIKGKKNVNLGGSLYVVELRPRVHSM
jgi:hypothetical protein